MSRIVKKKNAFYFQNKAVYRVEDRPTNICLKMTLTWWRLKLKVPLTPNVFLSRQKSPFCSDHIAEKIIVVKFFLDFIWIFKIRKIRTTGVHDRVTRRVDRVGLWRQPGSHFAWSVTCDHTLLPCMERWWESEQTADQRSQREHSDEKILHRLIGVLLRIAVMWWICLNVCLYTTYIPSFGD